MTEQLTETLRAANAPPAVVFGPTLASLVYLNFTGAQDVAFHGAVTVNGIDVPAFAASRFGGKEQAIIDSLVESLRGEFGDGVQFTSKRPAEGSDYSTIYIGGDGHEFLRFGKYLGIAEQGDGSHHGRTAFVFSAGISAEAGTTEEYGRALAGYVEHEAGHLLGYEHLYTPGDQDGLDAEAFKPYTHVEIARDVRDDLLDDGKLTIAGRVYEVHPKVLEAIRNYPSYYYGGSVGPDGFPDFVLGQSVIHPLRTGEWLARVLDMAWQWQKLPDWTASPEEKLQVLAWAYGFLIHAAGDTWAHTLVNESRKSRAMVRILPMQCDISLLRLTLATPLPAMTAIPSAANCPTAISATTAPRASSTTHHTPSFTNR
jgi:hypothetical protein